MAIKSIYEQMLQQAKTEDLRAELINRGVLHTDYKKGPKSSQNKPNLLYYVTTILLVILIIICFLLLLKIYLSTI